MVTRHPWNGHPPSKYGYPPSLGWSPTISSILTNHLKEGHLPSPGWSSIEQNMVTSLLKDYLLASKGWSSTIPSMVSHHPKLMRSYKISRNFNQTWSLIPAQLSLVLKLFYIAKENFWVRQIKKEIVGGISDE